MFVLGHTGISLLTAYVADRTISRPSANPGSIAEQQDTQTGVTQHQRNHRGYPRLRIDYRLVLLGTMLPDIIDKPLALLILPDDLYATRAFGHSAFFTGLLLLAAAVLFLRWRSPAMMVIALGSMGHLIMDRMWSVSEVLWWPYHGWGFGGEGGVDAIKGWLDRLYSSPSTYVPEIVGGVVVAAMIVLVCRRRRWVRFLRSGRPAEPVEALTPQ